MSTTVSLRIPDEIAKQLDDLSLETRRSRTFLITDALRQYLEDAAEYQIALDRLHDKDDPVITPDAMRRTLGL
jgi:RHH-type rel operon transcriptional repressor/antitoxin RelB